MLLQRTAAGGARLDARRPAVAAAAIGGRSSMLQRPPRLLGAAVAAAANAPAPLPAAAATCRSSIRRPRRPARAAAVRVAALAAGAADFTVRVRGDPGRVSFYCADLREWPSWSKITKSAAKLGPPAEPIGKGTRFELKQELWGVSYTML